MRVNADDLVIENSENVGISILSPGPTSQDIIFFGDWDRHNELYQEELDLRENNAAVKEAWERYKVILELNRKG